LELNHTQFNINLKDFLLNFFLVFEYINKRKILWRRGGRRKREEGREEGRKGGREGGREGRGGREEGGREGGKESFFLFQIWVN
jgi:hypothetical protein